MARRPYFTKGPRIVGATTGQSLVCVNEKGDYEPGFPGLPVAGIPEEGSAILYLDGQATWVRPNPAIDFLGFGQDFGDSFGDD